MRHRAKSIDRALLFAGALITLIFSSASANFNTNGNTGVVRTQSAKTHGKLKLNLNAGINFNQSGDYLKGPVRADGTASDKPLDYAPESPTDTVISFVEPARLLSSNISASLGILSLWDLSLSLPFYYDWSGIKGLNSGGLGDLEVSTKLRQPPIANILYQAYFVAATVPVGMRDQGLFPRHPYLLDNAANKQDTNPAKSFYSSATPMIKAMLLWTLDLGTGKKPVPLAFDLNLGGVFSADWGKRNTAIGGLAITYTPAPFISLFVDANAEVRWSSFSSGIDMLKDPFYISPGLRINTPGGLYLLLAGDYCLSSQSNDARNNWRQPAESKQYGYSTAPAPQFGVHFMLGWGGFLTVQDDDKDGIKNDDDRCPKQSEDVDGFEDSDGCADSDNDRDGVSDSLDKCPNDPEDRDAFQDEDGCPEPDNEKDGISDLKDNCPNQPEDFDGFEDKDGCPDFDNDRDGIADTLDKCPNDPEDFDGFLDNDGCADLDNDQDGITDLKDKCPIQPETFNGYNDEDGCADTVPVQVKKREADLPRIQNLFGLQFAGKTSQIVAETYKFLEPTTKVMKEFPDVEIEIRGFWDSAEKFEPAMRLSQARADAVREYFMTQGVAPQRMRAVGLGPASPIGDNRTASGRQQNRRIEIVRTK